MSAELKPDLAHLTVAEQPHPEPLLSQSSPVQNRPDELDNTLTSTTFDLAGGEPVFHSIHGEVIVHDAKCRYTLDIPEELDSKTIVTYINGLFAFKKTMRGICQATALNGRAGLRSSPIRKSNRGKIKDITDASGLHVDETKAILDHLASNPALQDIPNGDKLDFNKINIGAHSYGGDIAIRYALAHPKDVANIVLIKPVGMEDPQGFDILKRVPGFVRHELLPFLENVGPEFGAGDAVKAAKHIWGNPFLTIGEIRACMKADNRRHIWPLGDLGIRLAILSGHGDHLIPADNIETLAHDLVDHYDRLDTDHLGPQNQPHKLARAVIGAFVMLEARQQSRTDPLVPEQRSATV